MEILWCVLPVGKGPVGMLKKLLESMKIGMTQWFWDNCIWFLGVPNFVSQRNPKNGCIDWQCHAKWRWTCCTFPQNLYNSYPWGMIMDTRCFFFKGKALWVMAMGFQTFIDDRFLWRSTWKPSVKKRPACSWKISDLLQSAQSSRCLW